MKLPRRNFLHVAAGAAALPTASRFAWAQAYPSRPVRWVVGFVPGGAEPTASGRRAWTRVARSVITACLAWSFSTALAQAEALASTARSLRARASFSTVGLQSVAFCSSGIACVLWSFSAAFGCELEVAGGAVRRLLAGV